MDKGHYKEQKARFEAICTLHVTDLRYQLLSPWMTPLWCRAPPADGGWIWSVAVLSLLTTEWRQREGNTGVIALSSKFAVNKSGCRACRFNRSPSKRKLVSALQQRHMFFRIPIPLSTHLLLVNTDFPTMWHIYGHILKMLGDKCAIWVD